LLKLGFLTSIRFPRIRRIGGARIKDLLFQTCESQMNQTSYTLVPEELRYRTGNPGASLFHSLICQHLAFTICSISSLERHSEAVTHFSRSACNHFYGRREGIPKYHQAHTCPYFTQALQQAVLPTTILHAFPGMNASIRSCR